MKQYSVVATEFKHTPPNLVLLPVSINCMPVFSVSIDFLLKCFDRFFLHFGAKWQMHVYVL